MRFGLHPLRSEWRVLSKGRSFPFVPPFPTHTFPALHTSTCFSHPSPPRSRILTRTMFWIKADPRSLPCYTSPLIIAQLSPLYTSSLTIISTTLRYTPNAFRSTFTHFTTLRYRLAATTFWDYQTTHRPTSKLPELSLPTPKSWKQRGFNHHRWQHRSTIVERLLHLKQNRSNRDHRLYISKASFRQSQKQLVTPFLSAEAYSRPSDITSGLPLSRIISPIFLRNPSPLMYTSFQSSLKLN